MVSGVNSLGIQNFNNKIGINNNLSIKPSFSTTACREEGKHVTVNGKQYNIIKVPDNNPLKSTFAQEYKEVVFIDGKAYDVKEVSDWMACDKTKQVVIVDGKPYDVKSGEAFPSGILDNILNPHICYNA